MPLLEAAAIGASTLGGLFGGGGGGPSEEQKALDRIRARLGIGEAQFQEASFDERLQQLLTQGQLGQLGLEQGRQNLQRGQFGFETARDLRGRLQSFADAPGFDTRSLERGLLSQFQQQSKNTQSGFAQRGFGGSGAQAGALANQYAGQVSLPIAQLRQQSFENQRRGQLSALGQLGGLT